MVVHLARRALHLANRAAAFYTKRIKRQQLIERFILLKALKVQEKIASMKRTLTKLERVVEFARNALIQAEDGLETEAVLAGAAVLGRIIDGISA